MYPHWDNLFYRSFEPEVRPQICDAVGHSPGKINIFQVATKKARGVEVKWSM